MHKLTVLTLQQAGKCAPLRACDCALGPCPGWESFTEERWPLAQMRPVGTLRDPEIEDPTTEEYHPQGTRYDAADAPIAVGFYPYNRCDVHACNRCQRVVLRYTEFGGYYVDHRLRQLDPALVV